MTVRELIKLLCEYELDYKVMLWDTGFQENYDIDYLDVDKKLKIVMLVEK